MHHCSPTTSRDGDSAVPAYVPSHNAWAVVGNEGRGDHSPAPSWGREEAASPPTRGYTGGDR